MNHAFYFISAPQPHAVRQAEGSLDVLGKRVLPQRTGVRFHVESSAPRLLAKLRSRPADALVVDARGETGPVEASPALRLLDELFGNDNIGGPIGREQIWLVVEPSERGTQVAFEAGRLRIFGTIASAEPDAVNAEVIARVGEALARQSRGKIALCLAGGGIEGLFYELGALRALSYFLPDVSLCDMDIHCGISAGAILSAFLANGLGPREIARGMERGEGKLDRIHRREIFDLNVKEFVRRCGSTAWEVLRAKHTPSSAAAQLIPSGVFAGDRLRDYLARQLAKPGMTDSFNEVRRQLYIGATDQDTAQHVVFGAGGLKEVPISLAVRASVGLTPFYAPQKIRGRYYSDGGFTRTTNMRVAVQQGATMVLLIDPLIPVYSEQAGFVQGKGALFGAAQGLKALINSRFDKAVSTLREMYPQVTFHLFQPDGATMKAMSGSPIKYFYRPGIEELSFRETVRDIRGRRFEYLARDFARHGIRLVDPDVRRSSEQSSGVQVA
ncbi:MAG TPA: patatin-like phospholipase family protein [Polyangiaceae bacterium]|nr:patatin-like phospholipase family protein [Polyangiaceae bacterium]